jgi:exopolyphosphatase / guanosine-5'-triphosphate,3'-diphosphate pyrophosphatase
MPPVKVAVVDVGSNSVRLLVASVAARHEIKQLRRERAYLRLGDDAYRLGHISDAKLEETRRVARRYARIARKREVERLSTIVTAPGRQASNPGMLLDTLAEATDAPVVLLDAEAEGRLAWEGAVARMKSPPQTIAVVDLGGGSFELAVGSPGDGPTWIRSRDGGALRVTRAFLGEEPWSADRVEAAREEIRALVADLDPPLPDVTLAVGGTARALGRLLGTRYGGPELEDLVRRLVADGAGRVTKGTTITPERAATLLGGTLVLTELSELLDTGLEVGRGGLREGAVLALARSDALAA